MPEDQPVEQTEEVPKKAKKKRGRPRGKKKMDELSVLAKVADQLAKVSKRLDKIEEGTLNAPITARGPGAPTTNERANRELMPQLPGPAREEESPMVRDKERRDGIYEAREKRGRFDRAVMPSGVVSSVGNRQRRDPGPTSISNQPQ